MTKETKGQSEITPSGITRKEAIQKMGKYGALISLGTFIILNPQQAAAQSAQIGDGGSDGDANSGDNPPNPDGWGDD